MRGHARSRPAVVGVDTGGTFTDLAAVLEDGSLMMHKVPSTPLDPSEAVLRGLKEMRLVPGFALVHGTTVATNALLERRGATTALLTSQGCRDVLEIARQTRAELYALAPLPREPLVPRTLRFEVPERLDWRGEELIALDLDAVDRSLDHMVRLGVQSLAICFLFCFLSPDHERSAASRARARGLNVSISSDIAPEFREYERTATVCANAFVAPVMQGYMDRLGAQVRDVGASRLSVMQSNGGTMRAQEAASQAVRTVLSGPAGGLVAAVRMARECGYSRIMTIDMGGTSTDVALVNGEEETIRTGEVAGIPLLTPMLDIHTVGAGGGSIVRLDAAGGLRVGPESAGADPGPVAYGTGNRLTVTDANVMLGRIPSGTALAGTIGLDAGRVHDHFLALSEQMRLSPAEAAAGVISVVNAQMARALRHISVVRGRDPADYALVCFGGAGGLHGCALAQSVGICRILVPRFPGIFSALGLAQAPVRREYARTVLCAADEGSLERVFDVIRALAAEALRDMTAEGIARTRVRLKNYVEARYVGQSYSLRLPVGKRLGQLSNAFHRAHRSRYGHADAAQVVQIVGVCVTATDSAAPPSVRMHAANGGSESAQHPPTARPDTANVWVDGRWERCPAIYRDAPSPQLNLSGPALILQPDATTFVAPTWSCSVGPQESLVLERFVRE